MSGYSRAEFQQMTTDENLRPLESSKVAPGVDMLIAEGRRRADSEMDEPHWLVTWALTRDEKVVEASVIRIPVYVRMPLTGNITPSTQHDRVEIAKRHAQRWIDASKQAGWI